MLQGVMYIVCMDAKSGEIVAGVTSCAMCKKLIINAGLSKVVIRDTKDDYRVIAVRDWIFKDESLSVTAEM